MKGLTRNCNKTLFIISLILFFSIYYIKDAKKPVFCPRQVICFFSSKNQSDINGAGCRTNFVTLKYKTDSWGLGNVGFTLVITAFKVSINVIKSAAPCIFYVIYILARTQNACFCYFWFNPSWELLTPLSKSKMK